MGLDKILLLVLPILFTSAVFANDSKLVLGNISSSLSNGQLFQVPFIGNSSRPTIPGLFINRFPGLSNIFSPIRQKRSVAPHKHEHENALSVKNEKSTRKTSVQPGGQHDKLAIVTRFTSCNYTARPGRQCRSCRESITCYPNNRGVVSRCFLLFRYCNNGRCSMTPGARCQRTSTTTSTTSTETDTTETDSTSTTSATTSATSTATSSTSSTATTASSSSTTSTATTSSPSSSSSSSTTSTASPTSSAASTSTSSPTSSTASTSPTSTTTTNPSTTGAGK